MTTKDRLSHFSRRGVIKAGSVASVLTAATSAGLGSIAYGKEHMKSDLIIIGGSFAGLSAATQLGRAGRSVLVLDAGQPRNRFSDAAHGFFGFDGVAPSKILDKARKQTFSYPTIAQENAHVKSVTPNDNGFIVSSEEGGTFQARRVLISTGVADNLPDILGMRERWGVSVLHCPYCHGYEFTGKQTGVFAEGPMAIHQAVMLADWGPVTLFTNGVVDIDAEHRARLDARSVTIETSPVVEFQGAGQKLAAVSLADGRTVPISVMYIASQVSLRNDWISALGCDIGEGPLGAMIATDERQATNVANVYAAGDCARQPHNATFACADGLTAAMAIHMSLIEEELR